MKKFYLAKRGCAVALIVGVCSFPSMIASAAPAPPPPPAVFASLKSYVSAVSHFERISLLGAVADRVYVRNGNLVKTYTRDEIIDLIAARTAKEANSVHVDEVDFALDFSTPGSEPLNRAMIIESISELVGDCCVLRRFETLTFKDGKISEVEISPKLPAITSIIPGLR